MTALEWGLASPPYESGIDRGLIDLNGVIKPWNGLISVEEREVDSSDLKSYFDGMAYVNHHFGGVYQAVVTAYDFVKEFESILGYAAVQPGFFLTGQSRERFNFSYRTKIGEDGYKIHLVYNALATPIKKDNTSLNDNSNPDERQWQIDAIPIKTVTSGFAHKPSAHYIIDSTVAPPEIVSSIESSLYGTDETDPSFPIL